MKIICIGRNYVEHAKELGNDVPDEPILFIKTETALQHYSQKFIYPSFTTDLHYECELVLKINKDGKNISEENALSYFNEISLGIDFTARDVQQKLKTKGLPWEKAKGFDGAAIIGDWLPISAEEKLQHLEFTLEKNNVIVQKGNTELMLFSFAKIIAEASKYFTLKKDDLIYTGTPSGVGACIINDVLKGFYKNQCLLHLQIS